MGARHAGNSGPDPPAGRELNRYLNETPENLIMDALEFNCPSSDDLRLFRCLRNGGSGSSGFEVMRPATGAASVFG